MPRRKVTTGREIEADPKFGDRLVAKFINALMLTGKKSLAEQILYQAFDIIEGKTRENPLKIFKRAVDNVKPALEVRSRRVGGSTYQIPIEVRPGRRTALSIRWIISFARARKERTMQERLAAELLDASNSQGSAIKKREDTHRMAEANKAFAHYRW
ncbi:MAG: 30S ribosomal protein S7 [Nitrospinota bacterium]